MTLPITDGVRLPLAGRRLTAIATPGHTPGHICIADVDEGVLFSGDHILPRITPNVGLTSTGRNDQALTRYYESLERMKAWHEYEVLAAHEYRFTGLADRAEALTLHHQDRSSEILQTLRESPDLTCWRVAKRLTWARPWSQLEGINMRAALGEVAAHIDHLRRSGKIDLVGPGAARGATSLGVGDAYDPRSTQQRLDPDEALADLWRLSRSSMTMQR